MNDKPHLYTSISRNLHLIQQEMITLPLTQRQLCDLELIMNGGFSPLCGFLNKKDYYRVLSNLHLEDGTFWPIPIVLDVESNNFTKGQMVLLTDEFNTPLAALRVETIFKPDKKNEALKVYATTDTSHFGVDFLLNKTKTYYLGGQIFSLKKIEHHTFPEIRYTPDQLKSIFKQKGWSKVIGFQTRNPIHKAHFQMIREAAKQEGAKVLIHPSVGMTKDGDIDYITRVKCYKVLQKKYAHDFSFLSLLPLAMRMAGPREALLHAIIRKNYGCTHFIIGRAHADPGNDSGGKPFYDPFEAQRLARYYAKELGIKIVTFPEMAYDSSLKKYVKITKTNEKDPAIKRISGTKFREMLRTGEKVPPWFSFPETLRILRKNEKMKKGLVVFFTGLPCSGKSTTAKNLEALITEKLHKQVTLLDGDVIRKELSSGLGFSKEDRITNIRRIGFVASEISRHGGIVLCAALAPYESVRSEIRSKVAQHGNFVEVYLSTPIETCRDRDTKGMYRKAEKGIIKHFTGVSDPYEAPSNPEITIDTTHDNPRKVVRTLYRTLRDQKFL